MPTSPRISPRTSLRKRPRRRLGGKALLLATSILLSACGSDSTESENSLAVAPDTTAPAVDTTSTTYPFTFDNCGTEVVIEQAPSRVMLTESASAATLAEIGALGAVTVKTGEFPPDYYSPEVNEQLNKITSLTTTKDSTGGIEISLETVIDAKPDLVIGYETETLTRDGLAKAGIDLFVLPPYCKTPPAVSFESIYEQVRFFGKLFDKNGEADQAAQRLETQVSERTGSPVVASGTKGAALYVSSDGSALYAYSKLGMVHPQMTALGLTNPFADLPERVPEISIEKIVDANPDVLILLYTDTAVSPEKITELVTKLPGSSEISAVKSGKVYPLLFNFSEPPSPLVIDGLDRLSNMLKP
jgi:iron complex transport system substrate-binding protein